MPPAALIAIGASGLVLGAIAGSQKDEIDGKSSYSNKQSSTSTVNAGQASDLENKASKAASGSLGELGNMVDAGANGQDVANAADSQRSLADMLKQYQNGGSQATAGDISSAQGYASTLFDPQRVSMNQGFQDQMRDANRVAALTGRDANDPILRAKLAQEQTRQSALLDANQNSWAMNYAMQQPGQRLDFASQRSNILGGLATQAMQNRQALLASGQSLMGQEQNFRLNTASRSSTTSQSGYGTQNQESGGGLKGAITGGIAGAGAMMSMANGMSAMSGGGGGGGMSGGSFGAAPSQAPAMSAGYAPAQQFMSQNPYSPSGPGFSYAQPQSNPFSGNGGYQLGASQGFGQPRNYSLGSYGG